MIIREYKESDYEDILEISKHIWDGNDYLPKLINEYIKDPHCKPYVAEEKGKVISIVNVNFFTPNFVWLEAMRTHPDYRNRGIATALNQYLFKEALTSNITEIWLSTGLDNEATAKMLAKADFKEITLLKTWENANEENQDIIEKNEGVVDGFLRNIAYLSNYVTPKIITYEKSWTPAKSMQEVTMVMNKQSTEIKKFPYLVNEFNIFPLESYFVDSWIKNGFIFINEQTNSIMTFKKGKEYNGSYIVGIFDLDPDVIISALYFSFNQIHQGITDTKTQNFSPNITLFYPYEVKIKLLESDWVMRIMRKTVS